MGVDERDEVPLPAADEQALEPVAERAAEPGLAAEPPAEPEAAPGDGEESSPIPDGRDTRPIGRRRAWIWRAILVAGLVLALVPLWFVIRTESRQLDIVLTRPETITAIALSWVAGGEPVAESEFHFAVGSAPSSLRATVPLAEGTFELESRVERGALVREARQRVEFRGDEAVTRIHLR